MLASRSAVTVHEKFAVLRCRRLPGRLNTFETALLLGFTNMTLPYSCEQNCWYRWESLRRTLRSISQQ